MSVQVSGDVANTRMVDATSGIQSLRGSQRVGEGFLSSLGAIYANLTYHPVALVMLVLGLFILIAEANNTHGPFEIALQALSDYVLSPVHPQWAKNLAYLIINVLSNLIKYKIDLAIISLLAFPAVSKPSSRNFVISAMLITYAIYSREFTVLDLIILSQLFFCFANLRTPMHKLFVLFVFIVIFVTGHVPLASVYNKHTNSFTLPLHNKTLNHLHHSAHEFHETLVKDAEPSLPAVGHGEFKWVPAVEGQKSDIVNNPPATPGKKSDVPVTVIRAKRES